MSIRNTLYTILLLFLLQLNVPIAKAQNVQNASGYTTDLDNAMTIKKIALLPVTDNVDGIYSRPVEERLKNDIEKNHQYVYVDPKFVGSLVTPAELDENPDKVKKISANIDSDVVICVRVTKSASGVSLHLSLYLKNDGKLVAQQILNEQPTFETTQVQAKVSNLLIKLLRQIPYDGMVLSRTENDVTMNIGKKNGIKQDQIVTPILLIKLNRHPKFNFIISSEKEVLGKIKITKVEDTLSFGQILTEKGIGTIKKGTKISGIDFVSYKGKSEEDAPESLSEKSKKITFGDNPQEWRPTKPPTFGKLGLSLGLGSYQYQTQLITAGSVSANSSIYPSIKMLAELWITPNLIFDFNLIQGILYSGNPLSGSSPSQLSISYTYYDFLIGYNFLLQNEFFGPSIQLLLGFSNFNTFVDASNPLSLTSTKYGGFLLELRGIVPVTDDRVWKIGAGLDIYLSTALNETPETSAANSTNTMNKYFIFGTYELNTHMSIKGELDFNFFSSSFSGTGTRADPALSSSQRATTLFGGLEYMF